MTILYYTVLYREILIICAAFLREYSYICSHNVLRFTFVYAMLSRGNFKVPLTLTVKKKRMVRFEGLPEFKWSDLRFPVLKIPAFKDSPF